MRDLTLTDSTTPTAEKVDKRGEDVDQIQVYSEISQAVAKSFGTALRSAVKAKERLAHSMRITIQLLPPIDVRIYSNGGDLFAGLAMHDAILYHRAKSSVQIHTHVEGAAASAATLVSMAGSHRTITPNGFMLIHQLSSAMWGKYKYEEQKDLIESRHEFMDTIINLYVQHTHMPRRQVREILKRDLWFNAKRCLELGLVDEIL